MSGSSQQRSRTDPARRSVRLRHRDFRPAAGVTAYPRTPQAGAPAAVLGFGRLGTLSGEAPSQPRPGALRPHRSRRVPYSPGRGMPRSLQIRLRDWPDDLGVPGNRACLSVGGVPEDRVPPTLPKELTSIAGEMADEIATLHSTGTANDSRTTWWPSDSCLASSRLAWTMSWTASFKLSRASSKVRS